ncbi:MAG: hypothetical protein ACRDA4_07455 [Filifactoraceae bacterium]
MKLSKEKLIAVIIGTLTINVLSPVVFTNLKDNIVYADTNSNSKNIEELSSLQNKFFEISNLIKSDVDFTSDDVDKILKGTNYIKKVGSTGDSEVRYKYKNEEIILYSESYTPKNIGGVLYKIYNPNDNLTVLRVSAYNYDEIGWHTLLEASSKSIDSINNLAVNLDTKISKDDLFNDYKSIVDKTDSGAKFNYKELKSINPKIKDISKFKKNYYKYYGVKSGNNELVVDVDQKAKELYNLNLSCLNKDKSVLESLNSLKIDQEYSQSLKYHNVSKDTNIVHSLNLTSAKSIKDLKHLLINSLNY